MMTGWCSSPARALHAKLSEEFFAIDPATNFKIWIANGPTAEQLQTYIQQQIAQHPLVLQAQKVIEQYQQQARTERKVRASNASLNGAPHGATTNQPRSR